MFRCLSCGSSGALLTTFQSRSNLVKLTPVITPTFFSPYHRTFRCLGLAGPLVLFSLNSFRGPTRQSQSLFLFLLAKLPPCTPRPYAAPPPPLPRRPSTAARAQLLPNFAAAPRASARARAAPVPAPRCAALRSPAPPAPRAVAFHEQRRRFAAPPHARSPAPLPYSSRSKGSVSLPTPFDQAHSRCSRNCLLGLSSISSLICKGMTFTPCCKVKFLSYIILCTHVYIYLCLDHTHKNLVTYLCTCSHR